MHQFKKLQVWEKAVNLCLEVYKLTSCFPDHEKFALRVQMNKAVVSIPSNIAEGAGRNSDKEFRDFLSIANGSANELLTQSIIANRLFYITIEEFHQLEALIGEVQKMIASLQKRMAYVLEPMPEYLALSPELKEEHEKSNY